MSRNQRFLRPLPVLAASLFCGIVSPLPAQWVNVTANLAGMLLAVSSAAYIWVHADRLERAASH
jgi:hypothetical protein